MKFKCVHYREGLYLCQRTDEQGMCSVPYACKYKNRGTITPAKRRERTRVKTVRAWMVINNEGRPDRIYVDGNRPTSDLIHNSSDYISCTITFRLPAKGKGVK